MPQYMQLGSIPKKRHTIHPVDSGSGEKPGGFNSEGIYYEEVITTQGFSRAYSIAYHLRPPTQVLRIESLERAPLIEAPADALRHVHLLTDRLHVQGDAITGRVPLLFNQDCVLSRCRPASQQAELYRNARADELIFVHRGQGRLKSMFGVLPFRPMDYIVVPKCTTYTLEFDRPEPTGIQPKPGESENSGSQDAAESLADLLVVEAIGSLGFPPRYLNPDGQFRLGAPFCERDLHGPIHLGTMDRTGNFPVLIKDGTSWTRYELACHPFDVVGWDGMIYPFTFNADDFEPITGKIHQPPPIHQTFQASGFVVCTFALRLLDTHPQAIKVPYAHSNVESDEVLYYVRGQFGSRRGVELGSLTLHPHGIPHGPHPGTIMASMNAKTTDELAVMVDTFRPLKVAAAATALDDPQYPYSWL
jgi:homogentisate 1,2-dioxygenase